jgi:DNA-directed RNA polymerase subunit K/omega
MESEKIRHTKYEMARIIGSRALQISSGAPFLVKLGQEDLEKIKYNPIEIAKMEYAEGLIPIDVKRPHPKSKLAEMKKKEAPKPIAEPNADKAAAE